MRASIQREIAKTPIYALTPPTATLSVEFSQGRESSLRLSGSMSQSVTYLRIQPEAALTAASARLPTRVVVVVDSEVSPEWQEVASTWLVQSGCLYMMAWGHNCSSWDDSVDVANIEEFKSRDIPPDRFVMTT
jgi:hypothetical protein